MLCVCFSLSHPFLYVDFLVCLVSLNGVAVFWHSDCRFDFHWPNRYKCTYDLKMMVMMSVDIHTYLFIDALQQLRMPFDHYLSIVVALSSVRVKMQKDAPRFLFPLHNE